MPARNFFRVDQRTAAGRRSEQAGAVGIRDYRTQAGEEVARLGRIHYVHVFDGEWNVLPRQFGGQLVAIHVRAVEDGAVAPFAARLAA